MLRLLVNIGILLASSVSRLCRKVSPEEYEEIFQYSFSPSQIDLSQYAVLQEQVHTINGTVISPSHD